MTATAANEPPVFQQPPKRKRGCGRIVLGIAGGLAVLLVATLIVTNTSNSTSPPTTLHAGQQPLDLVRPFSPDVAWNRPVSDFGRSITYAPYAERFWKYGSFGGWDDPAKRGKVYVEFRHYSVPIYDARLATGTKQVYFANFGFPPSPGASLTVPWNDSWQEAPGNDGFIMMVDPDTGRNWTVWAYQRNNPSTCLGPANLANGFTPFRDACAGGVDLLTNEDGSTGDYRTWNSYHNGRGMGIPKLALVTTPYEVRAGKIEHALEMTVFNSMFGPPCTAAEIGTPAAGSTCGFYVPPATRVEWQTGPQNNCGANGQPNTAATREKTVPEGMRFALDISDADIEAWLDQKGFTEPLRTTAKIFAVALRDYGWIIAETGCYGLSIEVDGTINPAAREVWKGLGVEDDDQAGWFLDGLFTQDRIYVVNPSDPAPTTRAPDPGMALK